MHTHQNRSWVRAMEREHSYIVLNTDLSEEVVSDARPKFFPRGHVHDESVDEGTTQNQCLVDQLLLVLWAVPVQP